MTDELRIKATKNVKENVIAWMPMPEKYNKNIDIRAKYNPPDYSKINCKCFGEVDGMDGSCHYCLHNNPYQFEMCSDEKWKNNLIKGGKFSPMTESETIEFINDYKSKHCKQ